jgi:UDP:flavonoid glycosyltransferase YjiC (YdhE family)
MRIALVTEGTRGDVHPMLGLGDLLRARGHEVVVCAPPDFAADATSRGMEFRAVGTPVRELLEEQAEAVTGGGFELLRVSHRYMKQSLAAQFATLPAATEGADLVVGAGVQFAGASAAEIHGVPYRYIVYCPALLPSEDHPPVVITRQELPRWINRVAWRHVHGFYNLFARRTINRQRAKLGLARVKDAYRHLLAARPILAADSELAPVPLDCPFDVDQIRCLHPLEGPALPAKLESFLEEGPPPIYLGFGSMTDSDPAETTRAILTAVRDAGCRALISEGWAGLGDGPLPEAVRSRTRACFRASRRSSITAAPARRRRPRVRACRRSSSRTSWTSSTGPSASPCWAWAPPPSRGGGFAPSDSPSHSSTRFTTSCSPSAHTRWASGCTR